MAHGYNAHPDRNWFPWLRDRYGTDVVLPQLPDPTRPRLSDWLEVFGQALGTPDSKTIIVGHSLGCITVLRTLLGLHGPWELGAAILVAGFAEPLPAYPMFDEFTVPDPDIESLAGRIDKTFVLLSEDDPEVAPELTSRLADRLDATLLRLDGMGHFSDRTGIRTFDRLGILIDALRS